MLRHEFHGAHSRLGSDIDVWTPLTWGGEIAMSHDCGGPLGNEPLDALADGSCYLGQFQGREPPIADLHLGQTRAIHGDLSC